MLARAEDPADREDVGRPGYGPHQHISPGMKEGRERPMGDTKFSVFSIQTLLKEGKCNT